MFKRFKNICNREGHQHCHEREVCCRKRANDHGPDIISLNEIPENKRISVVANSDIKTMEMGLYPGSIVSLVHNESQERNIIVKIHDHRYVIPREIAKNILVKSRP